MYSPHAGLYLYESSKERELKAERLAYLRVTGGWWAMNWQENLKIVVCLEKVQVHVHI